MVASEFMHEFLSHESRIGRFAAGVTAEFLLLIRHFLAEPGNDSLLALFLAIS